MVVIIRAQRNEGRVGEQSEHYCVDVDQVRISVGVSGQVEALCNEVPARVPRPSYYSTGAYTASAPFKRGQRASRPSHRCLR